MTIKELCRTAKITRQGYYKEKKRRNRKELNEFKVIEVVKRIRNVHPKLGTKKLLHKIRENKMLQEDLGRDRLYGVLREKNMLIKRKKKARTTDSNHSFKVYKNLVKDKELKRENEAWASDITYIKTKEGFLYLSLITDMYSRYIVGENIGENLEATGSMKALKKALIQKPKDVNTIHHSDRGTQYCCGEYKKMLWREGAIISMTEENHCYENAMAERVNGILKHEYGLKERLPNKKIAIKAIKQAIYIYNNERPHMSLGMRTPASVHFRDEKTEKKCVNF